MDGLTMAKVKGDIAYCFGECAKHNPYAPASAEWQAWNQGYEQAMDDARDRVYTQEYIHSL